MQQPYEIFGFSISGYFTYDNSFSTPLDSLKIFLSQSGKIIDSTQSDLNGFYKFNHVAEGIYNILATTHKPIGGINGTDALIVQRAFLNLIILPSSLRLHAADVNLSNDINTTDALLIQKYFLSIIDSFPRGTWIFEKQDVVANNVVLPYYKDTVIINGSNTVQDIKGICVGDVNGSNIPGTGKSDPKVEIAYNSIKKLNSNEIIEIPVKIADKANIGAISLIINFPKDLVEILNVKLSDNIDNQLYYNIISNNLKIVWVQSNNTSLNVLNDSTLLIIKLKTKENFKSSDIIQLKIDNNSLSEFADENGNPINSVVLNTCIIEHINSSSFKSIEGNIINDMEIFPNPAKDDVNIKYFVANSGLVKIEMYNVLGEKLIEIVNQSVMKGAYNSEFNLKSIQSGIYTIKMKLENKTIIKRLVISK